MTTQDEVTRKLFRYCPDGDTDWNQYPPETWGLTRAVQEFHFHYKGQGENYQQGFKILTGGTPGLIGLGYLYDGSLPEGLWLHVVDPKLGTVRRLLCPAVFHPPIFNNVSYLTQDIDAETTKVFTIETPQFGIRITIKNVVVKPSGRPILGAERDFLDLKLEVAVILKGDKD